MTGRPDGEPGRRARILWGSVLVAILATVLVAILAYRQSPPPAARGSDTLPSQAAEGSGATPH